MEIRLAARAFPEGFDHAGHAALIRRKGKVPLSPPSFSRSLDEWRRRGAALAGLTSLPLASTLLSDKLNQKDLCRHEGIRRVRTAEPLSLLQLASALPEDVAAFKLDDEWIVEQHIEDANARPPVDFKCYSFRGRASLILLKFNRGRGDTTYAWLDGSLSPLDTGKYRHPPPGKYWAFAPELDMRLGCELEFAQSLVTYNLQTNAYHWPLGKAVMGYWAGLQPGHRHHGQRPVFGAGEPSAVGSFRLESTHRARCLLSACRDHIRVGKASRGINAPSALRMCYRATLASPILERGCDV